MYGRSYIRLRDYSVPPTIAIISGFQLGFRSRMGEFYFFLPTIPQKIKNKFDFDKKDSWFIMLTRALIPSKKKIIYVFCSNNVIIIQCDFIIIIYVNQRHFYLCKIHMYNAIVLHIPTWNEIKQKINTKYKFAPFTDQRTFFHKTDVIMVKIVYIYTTHVYIIHFVQ